HDAPVEEAGVYERQVQGQRQRPSQRGLPAARRTVDGDDRCHAHRSSALPARTVSRSAVSSLSWSGLLAPSARSSSPTGPTAMRQRSTTWLPTAAKSRRTTRL